MKRKFTIIHIPKEKKYVYGVNNFDETVILTLNKDEAVRFPEKITADEKEYILNILIKQYNVKDIEFITKYEDWGEDYNQ